MKTFRVLIYEDNSDWVNAFNYNIRLKLKSHDVEYKFMHRLDGSTIMQDLEFLPDLILVDYDLGGPVGTEILERLDGDPQCRSTSIFFYSGGESIEKLRSESKRFKCGIPCFIKNGDELEMAVLAKGQSKSTNKQLK
jgi:CheY-like chemotaxis protein